MSYFLYLIFGTIFGLGLAYSGMTDPIKVLGFLDIFGHWDMTLLFVMGGAVIVSVLGYYFILRRSSPIFVEGFKLPSSNHIDKNLIVGALIFGVGWGLYGYCPGPAIAALSYLGSDTFLFVIAMVIGIWLQQKRV